MLTTNSRNPAATPLPIICATPPRRVARMLNPAATSAIVPASNGSASSAWKCNRCRIAENPERSSSPMKSGNAQTLSVSGLAKLSCTRPTVRSVGNAMAPTFSGNLSGNIRWAFSNSHAPRCRTARVASIRASSRSWSSSRNTLTSLAINVLRSSVTVRACRIATPSGSNCRSDCRSHNCPPVSAVDPAAVFR